MNFYDSNDSGTYWSPFSIITNSTNDYNTLTTGTFDLTGAVDVTLFSNSPYPNPPDKNWMPYRYVEYDPQWHKKYAAIKYQMERMWD